MKKLTLLYLQSNLLWIICIIFNSISFAQIKSQKFTHFGKQDGLNQSSVNYIFQDSKDYVWIANFGGINKFDGYNFSSYINEFGDDSSISDNSVWMILESKKKDLWFGTKRGLSKYNPEKDNFKNYFIRKDNSSNGTLAVKALFEDKKGRFYVGSEGEGLYLFSEKEEKFSLVKTIPKNAKISAITEDIKGNLWVGTENLGLFKISSNRSKVTSLLNTRTLVAETIWSLYADEKGDVWIGTDLMGVIRYTDNTNKFTIYKDVSGDYHYTAGTKIKSIVKGEQGIVWIGSATNGLSYFSFEENRFYNYKNNPFDKNSLFDNDVSSIFYGANKVLYVGFYTKGFDKMISNSFQVLKHDPKDNNTLSNDNVYSMYLDHEGILWFGTYGGGLNKYDPKTSSFTHYKKDEKNPNSLSHNWVRVIYEDSNNTMWIGTWGGGLNKFDKNKGTFKRYSPVSGSANTLNHNIITALFEDDEGDLWIGTYGGGINIYQPETDDFRSIVHDKNDPNSLSDDHITSFYQDENKLIWICTYGGGLNLYNKETKKFERFLPDPQKKYSLNNHKTLHIFKKSGEDFFWVTTLGGGINKFYYKENRFMNYTEKDGLSNNSTMGMLLDNKDTYWISSNNGLSRFNPKKETFINYTVHDGLNSDDFNLEAYAKTKEGVFYFGGKNGVTYFKPEDVVSKETFPSIVFTSISVKDSLLYPFSKQITSSFKSRIAVQYAAINADKTDKIQYAYQLVGFDEEWRFMDKNRYLEFTNLDPGSYELRVRSTNSDNVWNSKYNSVFIDIPTPWYMTWLFRGALIFLFVIGSYMYYRIRLNRVKKRNLVLEEKVKKRTKTIKKQNTALKKAKSKTEKAYVQLKKLENFRNEFTSMLAHDLKNPLMTILGYSSENDDNYNLQSINQSGRNMLNLIENMLEVQKFENANVQLQLDRWNLRSVTQESISQVQLLAQEKRIRIKNMVQGEYMVHVDKGIMERVLVNLLTNAIKFSASDEAIEISVQEDPQNKQELILCVKDYGIGIPQNKIEAIFNKFSQVEARDSGKSRSTGLGLAFCKMAIEAHKGKIWIVSEINKGSSFFFSVKRLQDTFIGDNNQDIDEHQFKNPLHDLIFNEKDLLLLNPFSEKINNLSVYEMGEWMYIFDKLSEEESENIKKWKMMMMEALAGFDKEAFTYLKKIAIPNIIINKNN